MTEKRKKVFFHQVGFLGAFAATARPRYPLAQARMSITRPFGSSSLRVASASAF
jgi:hypothetical protein